MHRFRMALKVFRQVEASALAAGEIPDAYFRFFALAPLLDPASLIATLKMKAILALE